MPTTTSQPLVVPLISLEVVTARFIDELGPAACSPSNRPLWIGAAGAPQVRRIFCLGGGGNSASRRALARYVWISEVVMTDNRAPNGKLGAVLGALIAITAIVFLLN